MIVLVLRLAVAFVLAFLVGKLVAKLKLPSILGWLIAGMILGPHALSLVNESLLSAAWYENMMHILECAVGLMIGTELIWKKIRKSGKSIIITTLTQSLGTFVLVSLVFMAVFYFAGIPLYLAFIFGGIALATAPAPALSIVREFKTSGPVTDTLIPMAALDDIVGCVVFFTTIAIVAGNLSAGDLPAYMIALVVILPLVIGAAVGVVAGFVLKKMKSRRDSLIVVLIFILITSLIGFIFNNWILPSPVLNFMLIGMAFSAAFSNVIPEQQVDSIMSGFNPILGVAMILVILNLGAPLDYHLIMGAGIFTLVYIVARACGKYFGAFFGAAMTKSPKTVRNYLGFTLLPHSGVSLVFTGIAVSVLAGSAPECASVVQGTIAAAAVVNEIIAVIVAKKGFEWAGEFQGGTAEHAALEKKAAAHTIITISRQYGSGGREIGQKVAEQLGIPYYDSEILEMASSTSPIDKSYFENYESSGVGSLLYGIVMDVRHTQSLDDKVFLHQSKTILDAAKQGSCVIVGRCADVVLKKRSDVLKVFIYANIEERKHRVRDIYKEAYGPNVQENIEKVDRKREQYYNYYTGQKFGEIKNYNMCLDSGNMGIDFCVDMIKKAYLAQEERSNVQENA